jgi:hypothetical protein
VDVPEDVRLDDVESPLLGLGDEVRPLVRRAARVVDGPGEEDLPAAVDHQRPAVVGDDGAVLGQLGLGGGGGGERGDCDGDERRGGEPDAEGHVDKRPSYWWEGGEWEGGEGD